MNIFPAIDLIGGQAVRLIKGDYGKVTVYSNTPCEVAMSFQSVGAKFIHMVDLDGAKDGSTANFETIREILSNTTLSASVGGGIRNMETVRRYVEAGVDRVIIGTAAVKDPEFLKEAVSTYPDNIAVGVDIKDGMVAIKGWTELSEYSCFDFCEKMQKTGVKTIICTDVSKDGMMMGTHLELYAELQNRYSMKIIASGGVSTLDDVKRLSEMGLYGAILGKALYTGAIDLGDALKIARS